MESKLIKIRMDYLGFKNPKFEKKQKELLIKGLFEPDYPEWINYYEKEVFKTPIKFDSTEMEKLDADLEETKRKEQSVYFRYRLFQDINNRSDKVSNLYLFHCYETGLTKIGVSNNVKKRKSDLQNQIGVPLKTLHVKKNINAYCVESFFHFVFDDKRKIGEWFDLSGRDIELIKSLDFLRNQSRRKYWTEEQSKLYQLLREFNWCDTSDRMYPKKKRKSSFAPVVTNNESYYIVFDHRNIAIYRSFGLQVYFGLTIPENIKEYLI